MRSGSCDGGEEPQREPEIVLEDGRVKVEARIGKHQLRDLISKMIRFCLESKLGSECDFCQISICDRPCICDGCPEIARLDSVITELEGENSRLRNELRDLEYEISELRMKLNSLEDENEGLRRSLERLRWRA